MVYGKAVACRDHVFAFSKKVVHQISPSYATVSSNASDVDHKRTRKVMSRPLPDDNVGPSLAPCSFNVNDIIFKELVGSVERDEADGTPPHSRVFKIELKGKTGTYYALKIVSLAELSRDDIETPSDRAKFKFASIEQLRPWRGENPKLAHLLTDKYLRHQEDPFFRECRAFGKLNNVDRKEIRVVYCHGWLHLDVDIEARIGREFQIHEWDRLPQHENQPLRALIKDWIGFRTPFHRRTFEAMRKDLMYLNHKQYIFNLDICKRNYIGGWLIDFSSSRTIPHIFFQEDVRPQWRNDMDMDCDLAFFATMVENHTKEHRLERGREAEVKVKKTEERLKTLRSYKSTLMRGDSSAPGPRSKRTRKGQKVKPKTSQTMSARASKRKPAKK